MRKTNSTLTCLAIAMATLGAFITAAQSQTVTPIFNFTDQSWQYYQSSNQPPNNNNVDWKTNTYNDTAWGTGFGTFAFEPDSPQNYPPINTPLDRTAAGNQIITYYFRTRFNFPTNPVGVLLYFTNIVDDGMVVYLNGVETHRIRMPAGTPAYGTFASGTGTEGAQELITVPNTRLRQGDNLLAVELHDTSGSSDVAWTLGLAYSFMDPIVITRQPPANIPAVAFDDIVLSVDATGSDPRYWWFRNNVFLLNQTNRTLTMNNIATSQAGTYHVVVSNAISGARSSNTVMTVVPDTFGPRILSAYVGVDDTNRVNVDFHEDTLRVHANTNFSAFNRTNYFVALLGRTNESDRIPINQVALGVATARLTLATNLNKATNYWICINNIMDVRNNGIAVRSCVPISMETQTNVISWADDLWSINPWAIPLDGTGWQNVNYVENPDDWLVREGQFVINTTGTINPPCTFQRSTLSLGPDTYYFRKRFVLATNFLSTNILASLGYSIDDGAVFYLNGTEILRYNMTNAPINYNTRALGAGDPNTCRTNTIQVGHLLGRTNIFAVEVHQSGNPVTTDFDAAFDASMTLRSRRYPVLSQVMTNRIQITNHSPTHVSVYFINLTNRYGWTMQQKTNITDPWREVQPPTNRLITPKAGAPRQFYRLEKVH